MARRNVFVLCALLSGAMVGCTPEKPGPRNDAGGQPDAGLLDGGDEDAGEHVDGGAHDAATPDAALADAGAFVLPPAPQRDGQWFLYTRYTDTADPAESSEELIAVRYQAAEIASVVRIAPVGDAPALNYSGRFSPDGRLYAFLHGTEESGFDLEVVDLGGNVPGEVRRVRAGAIWGALSWSPDGRWLAVAVSDDGKKRISLLDAKTMLEVTTLGAGDDDQASSFWFSGSGRTAVIFDLKSKAYGVRLDEQGVVDVRKLDGSGGQFAGRGEWFVLDDFGTSGYFAVKLDSDDLTPVWLSADEPGWASIATPSREQDRVAIIQDALINGGSELRVYTRPLPDVQDAQLLLGPTVSTGKATYGGFVWARQQPSLAFTFGTATQDLYVATDLDAAKPAVRKAWEGPPIGVSWSNSAFFDKAGHFLVFLDQNGALEAHDLTTGVTARPLNDQDAPAYSALYMLDEDALAQTASGVFHYSIGDSVTRAEELKLDGAPISELAWPSSSLTLVVAGTRAGVYFAAEDRVVAIDDDGAPGTLVGAYAAAYQPLPK